MKEHTNKIRTIIIDIVRQTPVYMKVSENHKKCACTFLLPRIFKFHPYFDIFKPGHLPVNYRTFEYYNGIEWGGGGHSMDSWGENKLPENKKIRMLE